MSNAAALIEQIYWNLKTLNIEGKRGIVSSFYKLLHLTIKLNYYIILAGPTTASVV